MKTEMKLAKVFANIATEEQTLESTAAGILAIVKENKVTKVEKWDELVKAAYEANGWNTRAGRPSSGEVARLPVPQTVSSYAALVRQALRSKVKVFKYDTFTALRVDLAKRSGRADHRTGTTTVANDPAVPEGVKAGFVGVALRQPTKPNGSLFHDLSAVYIALPEGPRAEFEKQLNRLLAKYLPLTKLEIKPKAPVTVPKGIEGIAPKRVITERQQMAA